MKNCHCGHTDEEHRVDKKGRLHECEIADCDCIYFEWDGEDEDMDKI